MKMYMEDMELLNAPSVLSSTCRYLYINLLKYMLILMFFYIYIYSYLHIQICMYIYLWNADRVCSFCWLIQTGSFEIIQKRLKDAEFIP